VSVSRMLANTERGSGRSWMLMSPARRHATAPRASLVAESGSSYLPTPFGSPIRQGPPPACRWLAATGGVHSAEKLRALIQSILLRPHSA
jgi:hypothetical protein